MKRLIAILLACVVSILAQPQNRKLALDLRDIEPESTLDVIVQYKSPSEPISVEQRHRRIESYGGRLKADLSGAIQGSAYQLPAKALERLAEHPDVLYISPDRALHATLDYSTVAVNAGAAWQNG